MVGAVRHWRADDGARLAYRAEGSSGSGTPVLLLHSLFHDGTMFDAVLPALRGRPVIRPDHRGQGGSEMGEAAPTAERLAADTLGLLDHLGCRAVHVVGSSMGAYVALEMLRAAPERIVSLTLSCCTCRAEADPSRFDALADRIEAAGGRGLGAELGRLMYGATFLAHGGEERDRWLARLDDLSEHTGRVVRAIFAHRGWTDPLRVWGGPLLAISGQEDRAKSPADLAWIEAEGVGRHVAIPGVGHTPPVETPHAFAAEVAGFIEASERERAA